MLGNLFSESFYVFEYADAKKCLCSCGCSGRRLIRKSARVGVCFYSFVKELSGSDIQGQDVGILVITVFLEAQRGRRLYMYLDSNLLWRSNVLIVKYIETLKTKLVLAAGFDLVGSLDDRGTVAKRKIAEW